MRKPLAALAACSLIAAVAPSTVAAGTAAAAPAAAAGCSRPTVTSATTSPRTVVVGPEDPTGFVLTVKVRQHGCTVKKVQADIYSPTFGDTYDLDRVSRTGDSSVWDIGLRLNPGSIANADAGTWVSYVYLSGQASNSDYGPDIKVLRAARLSADAAPEPVQKGKTITVSGRLDRANWEKHTYQGYGGRSVELQWRAPKGSWAKVATVKSAAAGDVRAKVRASRDGCYRYVFAGDKTSAAVTSGADCVDVS
jgi:hypothetical protein